MKRRTHIWGCLVVGAALAVSGCKRFERKHIPVDSVEELPYPDCATDEPKELLSEHLRSGPTHPDKTIVERYRLEDRGCVYAMTVRQEWPLGTADVEVLWDREMRPLRVWKRMSLPGIPDAEKRLDIRRYELRSDPVSIKRRQMSGEVDYELLKGGKPLAVIGPGRGLIAAWIRRAKLAVGEKRRELAIDVRGLEKIEPVTLLREPDMEHPDLGHVQVYTFYGRETVFVDARGAVVGDLAGLRPHRLLTTEPPPALPAVGTPDPRGTP